MINKFIILSLGVIIIFILYCLNYPVEFFSDSGSDSCCNQKRSPEVAEIIGPNCSVTKQIKNPFQLGVSGGGSIGDLINNAKALVHYNNNLISEPALGCNFFIKSGVCNDTSVPECQGKARYIYHEGIPNPNSKCLQNMGINPGMGSSKRVGLVSGMIQDTSSIVNIPSGVVNSMKGKSSNTSVSHKCILHL